MGKIDKLHKRCILHYNFYQSEDNKVNVIHEIPLHVLLFLLNMETRCLNAPIVFEVSKQKRSARQLGTIYGIQEKQISKTRRISCTK